MKITINILPEEILMLILMKLGVKDVANCSLVSKKWKTVASANHFWHQLAIRDFPDEVAHDEKEEGKDQEVHPEADGVGDKDIKFDQDLYSQVEVYESRATLIFSADLRKVEHVGEGSTHRNAPVSTGFLQGIHKWNVRVDGLNGNMWAALGTTIIPRKQFTYDFGAGFVGYSSAGSVFYKDKKYDENGPGFKNGDLLSVTLNCDRSTLDIAVNGDPLPTLQVPQKTTLYPWFNLYQPGSSFTLLDGSEDDVPMKVKSTASEEHITFDPEIVKKVEYGPEPVLRISSDGLVAIHNGTESTHRNACVSVGFTRGVHRWRVKLDGLKDNMWTAIGTTVDPERSFTYSPDAGFVGYSSASNVFHKDKACTYDGIAFANGDIIAVTLNCDNHTLTLEKNGNALPVLTVQDGVTLYPWINLFQPGSSVTILVDEEHTKSSVSGEKETEEVKESGLKFDEETCKSQYGSCIHISEDGLTASHASESIMHQNACITTGFSTGRHTWHVKLDGMDGNMWTAIGTTVDPARGFTYSSDAGFVGYSSSHNIFHKDKDCTYDGPAFENGDIISVTLDCDAHKLEIRRNGAMLPKLDVQRGVTLYPWINLFQPGSYVTLLPDHSLPVVEADGGDLVFNKAFLSSSKVNISDDNRTATLLVGGHTNIPFQCDGWTTGQHIWHVKLAGSNVGPWVAIGTCTSPFKNFTYDTGSGFVGYSSAKNIFYKDKPYSLDGDEWQIGDVITLKLDCDKHTLKMARNGKWMRIHSVPDTTIYPWINIHREGDSVTLLDENEAYILEEEPEEPAEAESKEKEAPKRIQPSNKGYGTVEKFTFSRPQSPSVSLSSSRRSAFHAEGTDHCNVIVDEGWDTGRHTWHVKLDGLRGNFWTGIGTTVNPDTGFSYSGSGFVGYSSHKNIFYYDKPDGEEARVWNNDDIITVTLDCDEHTLEIFTNGEPLPVLPVQAGVKLYPWFNLYQANSSIHLLSNPNEKEEEEEEDEEDEAVPKPKRDIDYGTIEHFTFDRAESSSVYFSSDNRSAFHTSGSTHTNAIVTTGWTTGKHTWHAKIDGLNNHFWIGIGTAINLDSGFSYSGAGFVGYSSHKNTFYHDKSSGTEDRVWENGDIITVTLDCDARTLQMYINGEPLPVLPVQPDVKLYPWFNLYESGCSVVLLDSANFEEQDDAALPTDAALARLTFDEALIKEKEIGSDSLLEISEEYGCPKVTHKPHSSSHRNACISTAFSSGKHRWHMKVGGMNDHFWIAAGVTLDPGKYFTYETGAGFIGCSSIGNKFYADKPYESDGEDWDNDDVLSFVLDFDALTLAILRQGKAMATFDIPSGVAIYPWLNLYQGGCHATLLSGLKEPGTVFFDAKLLADLGSLYYTPQLAISPDGRRVVHQSMSSTHENAPITTGWYKGIHVWHLKLEGLSGNMWTAIGTTTNPRTAFSYTTGAGFVGYSSSHNIFYKDKDYVLTGFTFDNGDVISVVLDCNKRVLRMAKNGEPLPELEVQKRGKIYPWVNLYQPGSSVTILDDYTPSEGKSLLSLLEPEPIEPSPSSPQSPKSTPIRKPKTPAALDRPNLDDWKAMYRYYATVDKFCFDLELYKKTEYSSNPLLRFSSDCMIATHQHDSTLHRNASVSRCFTKGVHRWHVLLEGLSGNMWTAIGTTTNPEMQFTYDIGAGFVGYSSSHNIFYPYKQYTLDGGVFDNGDIISVTLNCDEHTLDISRNGSPLPTLEVQAGVPLYPWFNLYQPGSSVTLLPHEQAMRMLRDKGFS